MMELDGSLKLIERPRQRLVEAVGLVAAETVAGVERQCPSGLAEFLPEEEESVCPPVVVGAGVACKTVICPGSNASALRQRRELRDFVEVSLAETNLRLEENRSVLRELVLKTDSEMMTVRVGCVGTFIIIDEIVVVKVGDLLTLLLNVGLVVVIQIVATEDPSCRRTKTCYRSDLPSRKS